MMMFLSAFGAGLLAIVVYLISGVGTAIMTFAGIMCIVVAIFNWFYQTAMNANKIFIKQHEDMRELLRAIKSNHENNENN